MNAIAQPLNYIWSKIFEHRFSSTISFVVNHFDWKKRKTWEDAFMHSYRMFKNCLRSWIYDEAILKSLLLHDIIEYSEISLNEIKREFGYKISCIIEWMTWVDENKEKFSKSDYFFMFKMYCGYDWRILFVKLFDCIDNIETIDWLTPEKQEKFKTEKKEIYLPIFEQFADQIPYEIKQIYIKKVNELKKLLS